MWPKQHLQPDAITSCDASLLGAGGILWGKAYYRFTFPPEWSGKNIAYLEMWAIILCLRAWGSELKGNKIVINCDNESCCHVLTHGRSRDLFLQAAMREVAYLLATQQVELRVEHVLSTHNSIPD